MSRLNSIMAAAQVLHPQAPNAERRCAADDRTDRAVKQRRSLCIKVGCAGPSLAILLSLSSPDTGSSRTSLRRLMAWQPECDRGIRSSTWTLVRSAVLGSTARSRLGTFFEFIDQGGGRGRATVAQGLRPCAWRLGLELLINTPGHHAGDCDVDFRELPERRCLSNTA